MNRTPTIEWKDGKVRMIDQTLLPGELKILEIVDYRTLAEGIKSLRVRGAPAIGIAGAYGVCLGAAEYRGEDAREFLKHLREVADYLAATRPTAVNLKWALERVMGVFEDNDVKDISELRVRLQKKADEIYEEDRTACRRLGKLGAELLPDRGTGITHCNAGGLATGDYGTALGVIFAAVEDGKEIKMYADETRPLLQGARLTTWELMRAGIEVTLITDSTAGSAMAKGKIDFAIVGADRIANNGDVANKIGTYPLAVLAHEHGIPFYVAAPVSTIDYETASGADIPIEERDPAEVTEGFGVRTAPEGVKVYSPAFDVTPARLISAIITEAGVFKPPFGSLRDKIIDSNY